MKTTAIVFIILIILLAIFIIGIGCDQEKELEWKKISEGRWTVTNTTCIKENHLKYLCHENCYEKSQGEIWNFCKDKGTIKITNALEVLCFPSNCMPDIVNNSCNLVCPL